MRSLALAFAVLATSAVAQERPPEEEIFGAPKEPAPATPLPGPPPASGGRENAPSQAQDVGEKLGATENPLTIGGQLYLRAFAFGREGDDPWDWLLAAPALVDGYFDVRPNDRVRGFLLARMQYDPTIDPNAPSPFGAQAPTNPRVLLDQLWLRFDAAHTAFLTVGKQHVKWGTGRFWNPTDYLHTVRRDPLAVFDARTGTTMVRVHVPWERRGWNFSTMAILEPLTSSSATGGLAPVTSQPGTTSTQQVGGIGAAARAEIVLGASEIGAGAVVQRGHRPRFALDASAGILELDVYGEAALKTGSEIPLYRRIPGVGASQPIGDQYETFERGGLTPAVTGGVRWAHKYSDEDSLEIGVEYFYNRNGYADPSVYPGLLFHGAFTPFYLGQHYAGAYGYLPNPGSWNNTTFILSVLGNLSDRSFVARLDYSVLLLTYLRLEAYGQAHLGKREGEFRLAIPAQVVVSGLTTPSLAAQTFDMGVALRVSL